MKAGNDLDEIHRATLEAGLTLENFRKASAQWQTASASQSQYFTQAAERTNRDLAAFEQLVTHTDDSLNGAAGVLPALSKSVLDQNRDLAALEDELRSSAVTLQSTAGELAPVLANAGQASAAAARLAADPSLPDTLRHLDRTMGHLDETSASIERQVKMVEPVVKRATTPASLAARVLGYAVDLLSKTGSILAGYVK